MAAPHVSRQRPHAIPADASWSDQEQLWCQGERDADGLLQGTWRKWRADGSIREVFHFVNGLAIKVGETYHPDGSLASRIQWNAGYQGDSEFFRAPAGVKTDLREMDAYDASIVRISDSADGRWCFLATHYYDAQGVELTQDGAALPSRPATVPFESSWVPAQGQSSGYFLVGRIEIGTNRCLGLHQGWNQDGSLRFEREYDELGWLIWSRKADEPDPRQVAIDAFFAQDMSEDNFSVCYELGQLWTPTLHERCAQRLEVASDAHLLAYVSSVFERVKHHHAWGRYRTDQLALELLEAWRARGGGVGEHAAQLEVMAVELGARCVQLPDRAQGRMLTLLLGAGEAERLCLDDDYKAYVYDGEAYHPAPIEVCLSPYGVARRLRAYDQCDDRRLYFSGKHVFWLSQRYQTTLYLIGSQYFSSREQAEVTLACVIHCPDMAWTRRVEAMFKSMLPAAAKKNAASPFWDDASGQCYIRAYESKSNVEPYRGSFSRGIYQGSLLDAGGVPGVMRLNMERQGAGAGPSTLRSALSDEAAQLEFDKVELGALQIGYVIERIVPLPLGVPEAAPPKPKRSNVKAAPSVSLPKEAQRCAADELREAAERVERDDLDGALELLCEVWRRRPLPELADAIDALCASFTPSRDITGKGKANMQAWDELLAAGVPQALPALLRCLTQAPIKEAYERLTRVLASPQDPRVDAALAQYCWEIPYTSSSSKKFWGLVFNHLAKSQDLRHRERLASLDAHYESSWTAQMGGWARERVEKLLATFEPSAQALSELAMTPAEREQLDRFARAGGLTGDATSELLSAVFEDPFNDELRLSYAAKAAEDDPRASIIRFQAKPKLSADEKRELTLLIKTHGLTLAGPVAQAVDKRVELRLGFLSACVVDTDDALAAEVITSPYWNTVEVLDCGANPSLLSAAGILPALEVMRGLYLWASNYPSYCKAEELAPRERLHTLEAHIWSVEHLDGVLSLDRTYPSLRTLELELLSGLVVSAMSWRGELWERLERAVLKCRGERYHQRAIEWPLAVLSSPGRSLKIIDAQLSFDDAVVSFLFERTKGGWALLLSLASSLPQNPFWSDVVFSHIEQLFVRLPQELVVECAVEVRGQVSASWRRQLEAALINVQVPLDLSKVKVR